MRQRSSVSYLNFSPGRSLAALLVAAGLALGPLPSASTWAVSNEAHLDRQVLKAMKDGQSIHVILILSTASRFRQVRLR